FRGCTAWTNSKETASGWRACNGLFIATEAGSGQKERWEKARRSTSRCRTRKPMRNKVILLIEDNQDDEELTLRALRRANVSNDIVVKRDGAEALDYLFAPGAEAPMIVLMDLKLPKIDGLEVLRRVRAEERTRLTPVVILTSSREEQDVVTGY